MTEVAGAAAGSLWPLHLIIKEEIFLGKITIIDAGCGHGKTEFIINYMNKHDDRSFIYISPLREMFDRLDGKGDYRGRGTTFEFYSPANRNKDGTKLRDIKNAMEAGVNIKSTHALFLRFDQEAMEIAASRDYELVIDEDLNAVTVLSGSNGKKSDDEDNNFQDLEQPITKADLDWLLLNGNIEIDQDHYNTVVWVKDSKDLPHRYRDVEELVKTGAVSLINDCFIIWSFPISVFDAFDRITILTYRYRSSILKAYLDFYERDYEHKTVVTDEDGYHLEDFTLGLEKGPEYAELVNICEVPKLNAIGAKTSRMKNFPMSSTWYDAKEHTEQIEQLKKISITTCVIMPMLTGIGLCGRLSRSIKKTPAP